MLPENLSQIVLNPNAITRVGFYYVLFQPNFFTLIFFYTDETEFHSVATSQTSEILFHLCKKQKKQKKHL